MSRTRVVATLGPASRNEATITALIDAGVDVFRLNFSHGTAADHRARAALLRALEDETGRPIGILADLQGPKLRIGEIQLGKAPAEHPRIPAALPGSAGPVLAVLSRLRPGGIRALLCEPDGGQTGGKYCGSEHSG